MQHMDTSYTTVNSAYRAAREAAQDGAVPTPVLVPAESNLTDIMNARAMEQLLVDIALTRKATARTYTRKCRALRELVRMGVFTPQQARRMLSPLVNLKAKWRALAAMRREITTC